MRKGFTMLELVFIIVIIGILAAVILPRMDRDSVSEAKIELLSKIRYTQHLALIDDKYDANDANWFRKRWRIEFTNNSISIVNGSNNTSIESLDFKQNYNVNIALQDGCAGVTSISYDHVGRPILSAPMLGDIKTSTQPYVNSQLLRSTQNCSIVIYGDNNTTNPAQYLRLHAETGYLEEKF